MALEVFIKAKAKEKQLSTLKQSTVNPKSDERTMPIETNKELAKIAGVGHNTIHQYRVIKRFNYHIGMV